MTAKRMAAVLATLVVALTAACGEGEMAASGGDTEDELAGRTFLSESVTEAGAPVELVSGTRISLRFPGDGRLLADAGCNHLHSEVSIDPDRLQVLGVGSTEMGCDPDRHDQDRWLAEFLSESPAWALDADRLTLSAGSTDVVLRDRRTVDPDRPLAETRWLVNTLISGESASSLPAEAEGTAWLVLAGGGFEANTGCREVTGTATADGGQLRFTDVVQTDPACPPELSQLDEVMRTVLTGQVSFSIEAAQLRLEHPDGVGLGLHADE